MLAAQEPELVEGLLLLSYPLHPLIKPEHLRTAHFPNLRTPLLFVQGVRDSMGAVEEMRQAMKLIPVRTELVIIGRTGHALASARTMPDVTATVVEAFGKFFQK
jgi:predicted alpha/beta-hydrolase family hydrolase